MTAKRSPPKAVIDPAKGKVAAKQRAQVSLSPSVNAAVLAQAFSFQREVPLTDLLEAMSEHCKDVHGGDLRRAESMLMAQAHSLDVMFASLGRRAAINVGEYLGAAETYLRLALKAQSQCRATLETLATIKNPPVVFVKQANIAHGPQQVNNSSAKPITHADQSLNSPTELLEHDDDAQWLDTGTASATSSSNSAVEAVAEIHRAAQRRR